MFQRLRGTFVYRVAGVDSSQLNLPTLHTGTCEQESTQRPFTFNCPKCTQRITLQSPGAGGGVPGQAPGRQMGMGGQPGYPPQGGQMYQQPYGQYPSGPSGVPGSTMSCPRCRATLDVSRMPRPSTFNCPHCQTRIDLR